MKSKKGLFFLGLIVGIVIASASTVFATDVIKATLFPAKIVMNDEEIQISDNYAILNYNQHTYVPLRFIAENMGAQIGYDQARKEVSLHFPTQTPKSYSNDLFIDGTLISTAKAGKLPGIDIPLGTSKEELIRRLGEPDETGREHTSYLKYGNTTFYIWDDQTVRVIEANFDLSVKEIKEILGEPLYEGMSEGGYVVYDLIYETGANRLFFKFQSEDADEGYVRFRATN